MLIKNQKPFNNNYTIKCQINIFIFLLEIKKCLKYFKKYTVLIGYMDSG